MNRNYYLSILIASILICGCGKTVRPPQNSAVYPISSDFSRTSPPVTYHEEYDEPIVDVNTTIEEETPFNYDTGNIDVPESHRFVSRDKNPILVGTIYFDFDSDYIGSEYYSVLEDTIAKGNKTIHIQIEGNCDERGTEEYNNALGSRRAASVREKLIGWGYPEDLVATLSYGELKPVDTRHSEEAWKVNRRADIYLHPNY